ncbi:glycosyltransferase family 2 protein [Jejuia pallidilutea]|uniref:Probable glycosyl transferase n=1 Tax=Jejuia pallidilutea TaxID=504487 RepID=A0A090W2Z0_9FLAO|nr:glycosyltransferase family 2 protein [Jejuia pallidilutea]GAL67511.1 probable glycosyl transferase [Jejuia pallidilutea]GAL71311.1 probable glycosyl transferase [Jejuia pallidilutea]GAL88715.1 probable glycosyl transferase [Jejuia pallidilutea]
MISVVIPLYNKEHTITRTLGTVLNQTYKDFEVVIINDGSTDNGVSVIQNFSTDSRIKIINQSNQGVSVARNEGVRNATYEYVAFLDGDDEWLPNYLSKMYEAIQKFPNAGLFCCAGKVRSGGKDYLRQADKYKNSIVEIDFFENPHVFVHTSATVVKKSEFSKTQGFPVGMKRNQDFALFFALALHTKTVFCGFPLSIYVGDVEGQATKAPFITVREHVCRRYNVVHKAWFDLGQANKTYLIFTKYELRHFFRGFLMKNEYDNIMFFRNNLEENLVHKFPSLEWVLYRKSFFKKFAILYINFTKLRWRLRGYPRLNY